ncbi:unnamed protein product [Phaedon cochleariae]|uniref:Transient receptor ion channel domain-containing protein n=1 Tax=Phaedon cochleariae TaxID=80249 RepID=A0A9P0GMY6_PHACE|nr:unnamed protein product [Phaedon cochleariae]
MNFVITYCIMLRRKVFSGNRVLEVNKKLEIEAPVARKSMVMPKLPNVLSLDEKKYLLAVERGDLANVRRMLQKAQRNRTTLDINCMDSLGRGSLTIAIDQENLEMVELLVVMGVSTRDALLHAINVEFVEAVELLLEHEELIHQEGQPYSWQRVDISTAMFTPDVTPLILAAHRNNYEILKILLDRGATVPMPHDIKCGCDECIRDSEEDSLRHSLSRLNEYKALASPSLIALSSSDPLLTAFQLSWELRGLAFAEPECKSEYMELRKQCQQFAVDLLHQSRSSQELAIILNHDPDNPPYEEGEPMKLARLELAIQYKQKKFVAHPNIQQLLAAIWYEGVPGFRRKSSCQKLWIIIKVALLFPLYCLLYMFAPECRIGKLMRKPFMKFLIHASSYLFFLLLLILVSLRADDLIWEYFGTDSMRAYLLEKYEKQRGNVPTILEWVVLIYVIGFIYEETKEIFVEGIESYLRNLWNFIDFTRNVLYTAVFFLRVASYFQQIAEIRRDPSTAYIRREKWYAFDPQLIAEGLFAAANIFSALKLVHLFSINPHLGPLQISLGRMVIDIVKFFFIYSLVLFAFACGLNQLLWYFSDLERQRCYHLGNGEPDFTGTGDSCMKWRRFADVFESSQSLFWASFGLVDLDSFELTGIKTYTRFWGLLMYGSYSVINVIVLLNLLIAMMSNSYAMIDEHSDTEWKFARTKLWMSYFEETGTLPPPFNIFPKPKMLFKLFGIRKKDKLRRMSTKRRNREEKERDYKYTAVMRALVWRYVSAKHRKCEEAPVTEDDVNELKSDISSFRYEILEVLGKNGMDISSAEKKERAVLGRKMKIWERRLMKDFKVAPIASEDNDALFAPAPENEEALARFRRVAKLAIQDSGIAKWKQVVRGAQIASQIGRCHTRDSVKKQKNLQRAMDEAKRLASRSPDVSTVSSPIILPDLTGADIVDLVRGDFEGNVVNLEEAPSEPTDIQVSKKRDTSLPKQETPDLITLGSAKNSPEKSTTGQVLDSIKEATTAEEISSSSMIASHLPAEKLDSPSRSSGHSVDSYIHPSRRLTELDFDNSSEDETDKKLEEKVPGMTLKSPQRVQFASHDNLERGKGNIPAVSERVGILKGPGTGHESFLPKIKSELVCVEKTEVVQTEEDKKKNVVIEKMPDKLKPEVVPKAASSSSQLQPIPPTTTAATTPMSQRNIQRVHVRKVQPKYGWL